MDSNVVNLRKRALSREFLPQRPSARVSSGAPRTPNSKMSVSQVKSAIQSVARHVPLSTAGPSAPSIVCKTLVASGQSFRGPWLSCRTAADPLLAATVQVRKQRRPSTPPSTRFTLPRSQRDHHRRRSSPVRAASSERASSAFRHRRCL